MADTFTDIHTTTRPIGQRELQRIETRRSLAEHAIRLYLTQGYDATTVEEITAAAGVSTRTFFLHFRTKAEAAFPDHEERVAGFTDRLRAGFPHADPVAHLIHILVLGVGSNSAVRMSRYRLLENTPELRAEDARSDRDYEAVIRDYLIDHWGETPDARTRAAVVSNAAVGAVRGVLVTSFDHEHDPAATAAEVLYRMFGGAFSRPLL